MRRQRNKRSGQSLTEFALIGIVFYLLMAATIEMGRATFGAQGVQAATDMAAREISRTPLSVTYTSLYGTGPGDATAALNDPIVRQRIFDERLLVIDLANYPAGTNIATDVLPSFPVVNQQLFPLMIFDPLSVPGRSLLRYPGALVMPGTETGLTPLPAGFTDSGFRVAIPVVTLAGPAGGASESITWVSVVEEITPGAFSVSAATTTPGMVGIRINYPFQAVSLSASYVPPGGSPFEPGTPVVANDGGVTQTNSPASLGLGGFVVPADPAVASDQGLQPYGGEFGLGFQLSLAQKLRPFRSLISGQAVYRREVFNP